VQTVHLVSGAASVLQIQGACSPGRIVFDVAGRLWQVNPDGTGLSEMTELGASVAASPSVEVTGGRIVFAQNYSALAVIEWNATELATLVSMDELEWPAWSPDGSRIAFLAIDADTKSWDIHVIDRDGSNLRNITPSPSMEHRPTWTPDGSRIVFSAGSGDGAAIYSINPDGTDRDSLAEGSNPVPSPTGNTIAFFDGGMLRLMDGDGQNIRTVPESFNFSGSLSWSPDGRLLIFYAASAEHQGIATVDVSGQVRIVVPQFDGMFFPTISWGR
jgi:WD40 repeat protein